MNPALAIAAAFFLGCLCAGFVMRRLGRVAAARALVLALVILTVWTLIRYWLAEEGMRDLGLLVTLVMMVLPSLAGAVAGMALGYRFRRDRS